MFSGIFLPKSNLHRNGSSVDIYFRWMVIVYIRRKLCIAQNIWGTGSFLFLQKRILRLHVPYMGIYFRWNVYMVWRKRNWSCRFLQLNRYNLMNSLCRCFASEVDWYWRWKEEESATNVDIMAHDKIFFSLWRESLSKVGELKIISWKYAS